MDCLEVSYLFSKYLGNVIPNIILLTISNLVTIFGVRKPIMFYFNPLKCLRLIL